MSEESANGEVATAVIQEYSATDAALAQLAERFANVRFDCTSKEGMNAARLARREIKGYRVELEKVRKEIKEVALRRCQVIDGEARRITAALSALEDPIDTQIKSEERRIEEERVRAEREEAERKAAEESARIEAEQAKLAAERAELERQRAELERAQREREAAEAESRRRIEEQEREARRRLEELERAERLAREEVERKARAEREAEEARIAAERREVEERERAERAQREAERRERDRKANELLGALEMLTTFCERFGHLPEFAGIVAAIKSLEL